jgi:hypothetical protein
MTSNDETDPILSNNSSRPRSKTSFLLSHHPTCDRFKHHVVTIRGYDLCMGCLIVYPTMLVTLLVLYFINTLMSVPFWYLFILGCIFYIVAVIRRVFWKGLHNRPVHILFRVILGISLGCVVMSLILTPVLLIKIGLALITLGAVTAYQVGGWLGLKSECKTCMGYPYFPQCGGINLGPQRSDKDGPPEDHWNTKTAS